MRYLLHLFAVTLLAPLPTAADGVLHLGNVRSRENQVTVPITLQGDVSGGVASMNFELSFDPDAVRVVDVDVGSAARQTGKDVQWNETEPGRLSVVVMGLNQQTVQAGEIARLVVEPVQSDLRNARLHIGNSTFASTTGELIPSQGSTGTLTWRIRDDDASDNTPELPGVDPSEAPAPETGDTPSPSVPPGHAIPGVPVADVGPPSSVPDSVEQRLLAAREGAEAVRPLLGSPREDATSNVTTGTSADFPNSATESGVAHAEGRLETVATGSDFPEKVDVTAFTPNKSLEKLQANGHNTLASSVLEKESWFFGVTGLIAVTVGVLIVILVIKFGKGAR